MTISKTMLELFSEYEDGREGLTEKQRNAIGCAGITLDYADDGSLDDFPNTDRGFTDFCKTGDNFPKELLDKMEALCQTNSN